MDSVCTIKFYTAMSGKIGCEIDIIHIDLPDDLLFWTFLKSAQRKTKVQKVSLHLLSQQMVILWNVTI